MASRREFLRVLGAAPAVAVGALAMSNAYDLVKERDDALRVAREALRMVQHNAFLAAHPPVVVHPNGEYEFLGHRFALVEAQDSALRSMPS